jgi:uncharacterized protein
LEASFLAAMLALGLASGVHCAGMCGGIVGAFALTKPGYARLALFNAGRISTYALGGAAAGAVGSLGWYSSGGQMALLIATNLILILVGLHLAGLKSPMRWLERAGAPLWRRLQPHAARLMRSGSGYAGGLLWGWLPCGLVYGALTAAAFAGTPEGGAAAMLAYGAGTLPWLLAAGVAAAKLRAFIRIRFVAMALGGAVLGFGAWGLARAGTTFICS